MSSDIAIKVHNLSKCYQIYDKPRDRLLQMLARGRRKYYREFWALQDISFEIRRGETTGIIGRNGSGKSTLLQIICGTLAPTAGKVETFGRIAALLELGSGFNPEFTGRENIYMNGAVLGLSTNEIDARFDSIVAFADIGQFIDQPVKTYSSGMTVRLAFAVQSQIDPDILIVDEALSVGDAKFQAKCFDRLRQLKENGTSILLVTHSSEQIVSHCTNAILLDNGSQLEYGEPRSVINSYLDLLFGKESVSDTSSKKNHPTGSAAITQKLEFPISDTNDMFSIHPGYNQNEYRWGDHAATILDYYLCANSGDAYPSYIRSGDKMTLAVAIRFNREVIRPIFGITIKTKEGITVYGTNSEALENEEIKNLGSPSSVIHAKIDFNCSLATGDYFISLGVASKQSEGVIPHDRRYDSIHLKIMPDDKFFGLADLDATLSIKRITT